MPQLKLHRILAWVIFSAGILLLGLSSWPLPVEQLTWTVPVENGQYSFTLARPLLMRLAQDGRVGVIVQYTGYPLASSGDQTFLEARLEFAGLAVSPGGTIRQPNAYAPSHLFEWSVVPIENGRLAGTLWVHTVSSRENGIEDQAALTARPLQMMSFGLGAFPPGLACWPGIALVVIAVLWMIRNAKPTP